MAYIVWRLHDEDRNLWLPTDCATFEQAGNAWIECVKDGAIARIMEDIPIVLRDARKETPAPQPQRRGVRENSRAMKIIAALKAAPDGLSRKQIAQATGYAKTDAGSTVAGLMKVGRVRTEQRPPDAERGSAAVGQPNVTVYFLQES